MNTDVVDMEIDVDVSIVKSEPVHQLNRSIVELANAISSQPSQQNSVTNTNVITSNRVSHNDVDASKDITKNSNSHNNNDSDNNEIQPFSMTDHIDDSLRSGGDTIIRQQLEKPSAIPVCISLNAELSSNSQCNSSSKMFAQSFLSSVPVTAPICHSFSPPPSTATSASASNFMTGPFSGRIDGPTMTPPVVISPPPPLVPRPNSVPTPSPLLAPFSTLTPADSCTPITACLIHIKREREDHVVIKQKTETLKPFHNLPVRGPSVPSSVPTPILTTSITSAEAVSKKNRIETSVPVSGPFSSEDTVSNHFLPLPLPTAVTLPVTEDRGGAVDSATTQE